MKPYNDRYTYLGFGYETLCECSAKVFACVALKPLICTNNATHMGPLAWSALLVHHSQALAYTICLHHIDNSAIASYNHSALDMLIPNCQIFLPDDVPRSCSSELFPQPSRFSTTGFRPLLVIIHVTSSSPSLTS